MEQAIDKIINYGGNVSVGASFNIGQYNNNDIKYTLVNVENYMDKSSVLYIYNGNYSYHFNSYQSWNITQLQSVMPHQIIEWIELFIWLIMIIMEH